MMKTKMLMSVVLGSMLLCPGMQAGLKDAAQKFGKSVVSNPGTCAVVVAGECVGLAVSSFGLALIVQGARQLLPASLKITLESCRSILGKAHMTEDEYKKQWSNLGNGALNMVGGAAILGVSVCGMKKVASLVSANEKTTSSVEEKQ